MFFFAVYKSEDKTAGDAELVVLVADGDKKAMKALVDRYKKRAYFLALGMVGNKDEAFDISQEAFIRVFKSARKFESGRDFFPWFYSIVVNLCKDCLARRKNREAREMNLDDAAYLLVADSNPEAAVIEEEQTRDIQRALMELDFEDREIIMLKHFKEYSYDEIAILLKIPKGTVMSRLYYARKKLAKRLAKYV
jgi:RNA polymerase sigma-70 factor (ECF subfamily)